MLLASLVSFLAALLTLIAFAIDIALYANVRHQYGRLGGVIEHTGAAPGTSASSSYPWNKGTLTLNGDSCRGCAAFWMTFVSFILLCLAGGTVCVGRRRDRMAGATSYNTGNKVSWRDRFRRSA